LLPKPLMMPSATGHGQSATNCGRVDAVCVGCNPWGRARRSGPQVQHKQFSRDSALRLHPPPPLRLTYLKSESSRHLSAKLHPLNELDTKYKKNKVDRTSGRDFAFLCSILRIAGWA